MSERLRNTLTIAVISLMAVVVVGLVITSPTQTDRVEQIGSRIKCPVCQGESISNSPAQMARDMMSLVEQRVAEGRSDSAIIDELQASFSGAVLLDPPVSGNTLILWLAPVVVLLLGIGVIFWWKTHPGPEVITSGEHPRRGRPGLMSGLLLGVALIGVLVVAAVSIAERDGPNVGVADLEDQDLSDVSNETMEAVIAANLDNPQIIGMRLALAERYFGIGDYRAAFPHYLSVADASEATADEVSAALIRLGWMAWDGNGAVDAAIGMFDQALAIDADSTTARYLKGQVLWCGNEDFEGAASLFDEVLANDDLPNDSRDQVEADLDAVSNQERCA